MSLTPNFMEIVMLETSSISSSDLIKIKDEGACMHVRIV